MACRAYGAVQRSVATYSFFDPVTNVPRSPQPQSHANLRLEGRPRRPGDPGPLRPFVHRGLFASPQEIGELASLGKTSLKKGYNPASLFNFRFVQDFLLWSNLHLFAFQFLFHSYVG